MTGWSNTRYDKNNDKRRSKHKNVQRDTLPWIVSLPPSPCFAGDSFIFVACIHETRRRISPHLFHSSCYWKNDEEASERLDENSLAGYHEKASRLSIQLNNSFRRQEVALKWNVIQQSLQHTTFLHTHLSRWFLKISASIPSRSCKQ